MEVDKNSVVSVGRILDETTRDFGAEKMRQIEAPLQGEAKENFKLKTARYWMLRFRHLERSAAKMGVYYSSEGAIFTHPV